MDGGEVARIVDAVRRFFGDDPDAPDPNPPLAGERARGLIVDASEGEKEHSWGAQWGRWRRKKLVVDVVSGRPEQRTTVLCFLREAPHAALRAGVEIPLVLDRHGAVLGVDVAACETELGEPPA